MKTSLKTIEIREAKYSGDHKIKVSFNDTHARTINFESFLKSATNPMTKKFLNMEKFKGFHLKYGDLVLGDYEICFPIWDLYEGRI